ncbi:MAG TPA: hypothetical protein VKY37_06900, partial [Brumimicrobium sp.]|nr:hypothetical protein [Brumimicrobium sp.]
LDEETYLSATKAVELGLADEIVDAEPEEVESEVFKNEAEKFNTKIVAFAKKENKINDDQLDQIVNLAVNKIVNGLQSQNIQKQEPSPKPTNEKGSFNMLKKWR